VIVTLLSIDIDPRRSERPGVRPAGSALFGGLFLLLESGLARLPDDLDLLWWLQQRLELGQAGLVLRLLLGFAVRAIS
jgi:hypothetical protein